MTLINNLNAINNCKNGIKTALEGKGVDMTGVEFKDYAVKIDELQLSSGDEPSTPNPSADYIYSNGYAVGGNSIEIVDNIPHEIILNENGLYIIDIMCPKEIKGSSSKNIYDIILTIDVPTTYVIESFEYYDQGTTQYYQYEVEFNPRHSKIYRNNVEYNSYVRKTADEKYQGSSDISSEVLQYRITIKKI
jgi:hypothetical protein